MESGLYFIYSFAHRLVSECSTSRHYGKQIKSWRDFIFNKATIGECMRPFSSTRGLTSESRVPAKDKQQASYGDADCLLVFFRVVSMPHSNEFTSLAEYAACMRVHVHVH